MRPYYDVSAVWSRLNCEQIAVRPQFGRRGGLSLPRPILQSSSLGISASAASEHTRMRMNVDAFAIRAIRLVGNGYCRGSYYSMLHSFWFLMGDGREYTGCELGFWPERRRLAGSFHSYPKRAVLETLQQSRRDAQCRIVFEKGDDERRFAPGGSGEPPHINQRSCGAGLQTRRGGEAVPMLQKAKTMRH